MYLIPWLLELTIYWFYCKFKSRSCYRVTKKVKDIHNEVDKNIDIWTLDLRKYHTKEAILKLYHHSSTYYVRHCRSSILLANYPLFQDLVQRDHEEGGGKSTKSLEQLVDDITTFPNFLLPPDKSKTNWQINQKRCVGRARRGVVDYIERYNPGKPIAACQSSDDNGQQNSDSIVTTAMATEKNIAGCLLLLASR